MGISGSYYGGSVLYKALFCGDIPLNRMDVYQWATFHSRMMFKANVWLHVPAPWSMRDSYVITRSMGISGPYNGGTLVL